MHLCKPTDIKHGDRDHGESVKVETAGRGREVLDRHDLHITRKVVKSPAKRYEETKHRSSGGR